MQAEGAKTIKVRVRNHTTLSFYKRSPMHKSFLLCLIYAGLIFFFSSLTGTEVGQLPTSDFIMHGMEYTGFGFLLYWWRSNGLKIDEDKMRPFFQAVAIGSIYAATDEFHQGFVPGRTPDIRDWTADTIGLILGAGIFILARFVWQRRYRHG